MLAQVLWRRVVYQRIDCEAIKHAYIPQGTVVFLAKIENDHAIIMFEDMALRIPAKSLQVIKCEEDLISSVALEQLYHNKRSTIRED